MSMSKDRVRFTIPGGYISHGKDSANYRKLLDDVFGICVGGRAWEDVTVICRPSQFARFLIERHKRGVSNQFSVLNAEMYQVGEEPRKTVLDASGEPNRPDRLTYGKAPR